MTHGALVNDILVALSPFGHVWKNNSGAVKVGQQFIRYGQVGSADILGCIGGRFVGIEVKVGRDRLSAKQSAWAASVVRAGGLWCEARSVDDALDLVSAIAPRGDA